MRCFIISKKNILIKLVFEAYVKYGKFLKKIIPISLRGKFKALINDNLSNNIEFDHNTNAVFEKGINLIGYIKAEMGLGHSCRLLASALDLTDISWTAVNYDKLNAVRHQENIWDHKISNTIKYNTSIIHINPDNLKIASMYLPKDTWKVKYNIAYILWELEKLPKEWISILSNFDEIWAPSSFIANNINKAIDKPVYLIPYGIEFDIKKDYSRQYFNLPENVFLFLTMYDYNSTSQRKNPYGSIQAFKSAFKKDDDHVGLIIKINNTKGQAEKEIEFLKNNLAGYKNIFFIENTLEQDEVYGLINLCDCFISLHRSEGFGLVIAESMYLKKPVIATNWSANIEFMNETSACLVDFSFTKIKSDLGIYKAGQRWAEPDYLHAANYMNRLVSDAEYYHLISENAHRLIKTHYSMQNSASMIKKRLNALNLL